MIKYCRREAQICTVNNFIIKRGENFFKYAVLFSRKKRYTREKIYIVIEFVYYDERE